MILAKKLILYYYEHSSQKGGCMPKIYDDLRETILQEAKSIIVSKGYQKLNMREVAKASGIAVGTIYNYYPTKDSLMSELMYGYWMEFIAAIQDAQEKSSDLFDLLKRVYKLLESFLDIFKDTWLRLNKSQSGMTVEHHKQKQEVVDLFIDTIESAIKEHKKSHSPKSMLEIKDRELASFIVQNFMLIAQMKQFEYETFEKILKGYFL
jgi:AcrR family transcriptional regulator